MICKTKRIKLLNSMNNSRNIIYNKNLFEQEIKTKGLFFFFFNGIMGFKFLNYDNFVENREEND